MQYSHDLEVRKTRKIRQSKQMPPSWIFCFLWFCNPSLSISSAFYLLQHQVTCFLWPVRHSVSKYFSSHTFIEVTTSLIGNKHVFPIWLFSILYWTKKHFCIADWWLFFHHRHILVYSALWSIPMWDSLFIPRRSLSSTRERNDTKCLLMSLPSPTQPTGKHKLRI